MSADAWRICPKCGGNQRQKLVDEQKRVAELYGKVPAVQWLEKYQSALSAAATSVNEETLREDYEVFMGDDGTFHVFYACRCDVCGFAHRFEHEKKIYNKE